MRPNDIRSLAGDNTRAREVLGWSPHTSFEQLVRLMVMADLQRAGLKPEQHLKR
jgi:GDPmannose 4,6-dehydratase